MADRTNVNDDGLLVPQQDLSAESPSSTDHGRLYNHDGSSSITLVNGSTTTDKGFYMWDNSSGAWHPLKNTFAVAENLETQGSTATVRDTTNALDIARFLEGGKMVVPNGDITDGTNVIYDASNGYVPASILEAISTSDLAFDTATQSELNSHESATTVHGDAVPLSITHANWADGLSDEEVYRIVLGSGESLEIHRLEMQMKGGGSSTSLDVDVYDATNATVLASTTAGSATTGSPVATSNSGVTILVRVSNSTGSAQTASISGSLYVV